MDQPTLHPLAVALAGNERLVAFADDLRGAKARVSEPGLTLLLAALHLHLERALLVLLPEDADARDAAEAAAWYLGEERVALFPSRGVGWDSGLEPPPHLLRAVAAFRYQSPIFVFPPWPEIYGTDTERKQDPATAAATHAAVAAAYRCLGYRLVEVPRAGVAERAAFVVAGARR